MLAVVLTLKGCRLVWRELVAWGPWLDVPFLTFYVTFQVVVAWSKVGTAGTCRAGPAMHASERSSPPNPVQYSIYM